MPLPSNSIHQLLPSEFLYHLIYSREKKNEKIEIDWNWLLVYYQHPMGWNNLWRNVLIHRGFSEIFLFNNHVCKMMNSEKIEEISHKNKGVLKNRMILQKWFNPIVHCTAVWRDRFNLLSLYDGHLFSIWMVSTTYLVTNPETSGL